MVNILPRSAWTTEANGRAGRALDPNRVTGITVHYPGSAGAFGELDQGRVAQLLRGWRDQHLRQSWADIGYNYAIDQAGRVWDLTGLNRGAHAGGDGTGNSTTVGVLFIVGVGEAVSQEAIAAFLALRAWIIGRLRNATHVYPHSHWTSTACPGDVVRGLIASGALTGSSSPAAPAPSGWGGKAYTVTAKSGLNARSGPSAKHQKLGAVPRGTDLVIVEQRGGWGRATDGRWYSMQYLAPSGGQSGSGTTTYVVNTRALPLNGRTGPGTQYPVSMRAYKGARLQIVETRNGWARSTGGHWYSMQYLRRA